MDIGQEQTAGWRQRARRYVPAIVLTAIVTGGSLWLRRPYVRVITSARWAIQPNTIMGLGTVITMPNSSAVDVVNVLRGDGIDVSDLSSSSPGEYRATCRDGDLKLTISISGSFLTDEDSEISIVIPPVLRERTLPLVDRVTRVLVNNGGTQITPHRG